MSTTATRTEATRELLANAFADAWMAADTAAEQDSDDSGTCNLDTPVYRPEPAVRNSVIEQAARAAGVRISISEWFGRRAVFLYVTTGQGACRTRAAQAACCALEAAGLRATVYYQMD
jgi:hypothetical protein